MTPDFLIIGAGIVGAACAHSLSQAGFKVLIADEGPIAQGATAAGMGHIVVMDESPAQFALTRYGRDLWTQLAPQLPPETELSAIGTLWVAADEIEFDAVKKKHEFFLQNNLKSHLLSPQETQQEEPNLRPNLAGAWLAPEDCVIFAPAAAEWLIAQSEATVLTNHPIHSLAQAKTLAPNVILATGASTRRLLPHLPVEPRKGQLILSQPTPNFIRHQIIELGYLKSAGGDAPVSVAFNVQPRKGGQVLIGSSREFGATTPEINPEIQARMLARAYEYMPALANLQHDRTWTGFRASTPDKLPLIGLYEDNLYLATGHEGLGITTALATAHLLTDQILQRPSPIDSTPFSARRYPISN
jgi:D-hydroxyproline dehydrogenase subunit beta